jgi:biotin carboxyl carrier protein
MINNFNASQETEFSQIGQQKLTDKQRFMMETLLADDGIAIHATASPGPTASPAPAPAPTPAAAPAPTPTATSAPTVVNTFIRLALNQIKPGDLITADFANNIIEALIALDRRLTALEGDKPTPSVTAPTPSPTQSPSPTPTPTTSLRSAPTLEKVTATTERGKGVNIAVTGDNIGEGLLVSVLLGETKIAPSSLKFARDGFSFLTTTAIMTKAKNRLTVVTKNGEDSAPLTTAKVAIL